MYGAGWVKAGKLSIGNLLVPRAGPTASAVTVTGIERKAGPTTVYNFTVQDDHSYFVGTTEGGAWVHNGPGDCALQYLVDENVPQFAQVVRMLQAQGCNAVSTAYRFGLGVQDEEIRAFLDGTNIGIVTKNVIHFAGYNVLPVPGGNATNTAAQVIEAIRGVIGF